jgi:histidinol-phosphate aminotransferase
MTATVESADFRTRANPCVQALRPYTPGKPVAELERELGIRNTIKLASNENPLGPSQSVLKAIQAGFSELSRYPDGNGFGLKQALSRHLGINPEQITLGNGSNDVLELVTRAFANQESEIIYSQYSFAVYALATQAIGARAVEVPALNWGHDLEAMLDAVSDKTALIFVANPNNPTGTWVTKDAIINFLERVPPRVIVVLDEAYCEYISLDAYPDGISLLTRFPNLLVTRTFSKAYGLAALRVGYGISGEDIADMLNRVRQPFNVNSLALIAAEAALEDGDHLQQSTRMNEAGLRQLEKGLDGLNLEYIPSVGNFIAFNTGRDGQQVYQALLREGVIVRPIGNYGMPNYLRVSVGLSNENQRFLDAMGKII